MKVYFAGPLFNEAEKRFNMTLTEQIEELGFSVFLPQRDGAERDKPPYDSMTQDERRHAIFSIDRDMILDCDIFLFILDGRVPDEGACVELGIAYTQKYLQSNNKKLIGLQTDIRAAFMGSSLNPMLRIPFDEIFTTERKVLDYITQLISED